MKNLLLAYIKKVFSDSHNAIIAIILASLIVGSGSVYLFFQSLWTKLINTLQLPTPLWVTIVLALALYIWFSATTKRNLSYGLDKHKDYTFITEMGLLWKVDNISRELNPTPLCFKHQHEMLETKNSYVCHSCQGKSRKHIQKKDVDFVRELVTSKIDAAIDGHLKQ
jgi:hypothetical protein